MVLSSTAAAPSQAERERPNPRKREAARRASELGSGTAPALMGVLGCVSYAKLKRVAVPMLAGVTSSRAQP